MFATRSPSRPNPIGLHLVRITSITPDGDIEVDALEAVDGTQVLDVKTSLGPPDALTAGSESPSAPTRYGRSGRA